MMVDPSRIDGGFLFFFLARLWWNFSRFYDRVVARCARCFHVVLIFRFDFD